MNTRNVYRCFISSPSDCIAEREACQSVIDSINNGVAKHLGINFEPFMWEYDVLPDMGKSGQEIIDEYIMKSNYDIFIGVMKNRFGAPTKKAGSGTEHEYNEAINRKKNEINSLPRILFFFGKENIDPDNFDFEQYQKVKAFKSKISQDGLFIDFTGVENFKLLLKEKLELFIKEYSPLDKPNDKMKEVDIVLKRLDDDLNESLKTYNERSPVWIEPIISKKREIPNNPTKNEENRIELLDIVNNPSDIVIKAPSEFGLTTLAHYIKLQAWINGKTFLYIDSRKTKKHKVVRDIIKEAQNYYFKEPGVLDCILLDSVSFEENGIMQMVKNICDEYMDIPLIIFNTIDNNFFLKSDEDDKVEIKKKFTSYYLLPLPQNEVRKIVASYSKLKSLEEDSDIILSRVTKDLEALNMHRTPKNCISILRAGAKIGKEYTPINRTKLLETILKTVFEEYDIPTYWDKKPDVKDCNFVLGYFCELLLLKKDFDFKEDFFKNSLRSFCDTNFIDLDLGYLMDVLIDNSIFGKRSSDTYYFKNAYWVFYFIAQRMSMSRDFLQKIYESKSYIDFPEIIEFYTGIDRNREDAILELNRELEETLSTVRAKMNIPDSFNPFKAIAWNPDVSALEKAEAKIGENVVTSGLPDEIKDKYADKHYNQIRPYNQVINSVIRDYSFLVLMRQISAASRALRNSDFVSATLKKELLDKITQAWNEMNKLLIILSPLLAEKGNATFEGARFRLNEDDFKIDNIESKKLAVLLSVPTNVVRMFKDDLYSNKMGPLIIDKAKSETNSLIKHELMMLMVAERPKNWLKIVDSYIVALDKNSFYLSNILSTLSFNRDFSATEIEDKRMIESLIQKCRAKHIFKKDNPDMGLIKQIKK